MTEEIKAYLAKSEYMNQYYPEVTAEEFYSSVFPLSEIECKGDMERRASNPIFSYRNKAEDGRVYFRNEIVFSDHFSESMGKVKENEMALCSMMSYSGRRKTAKNAYKCHGLCIDLDGVGMKELQNFWGWVEHLKKIPLPTYVANSGHGLHVYYVFENPVPLFPQVAQHLQSLKRGLTLWVWNKETSYYGVKHRQFQGIYQGFRMIGSCTKLGDGNERKKYLVRAWKTGNPVSISYLNQFVEPEYAAPEKPDYASWEWADGEHHSLEECKELFPDWYLRRIVNKESGFQWKCNRGLYDWWLAKIQESGSARDGNRYHCVSMLYVYGKKCMIDKSLIDADALELVEPFNELTIIPDNEFTEWDVYAASAFYDPKFVKMTRKEVVRRTGISIESKSRNGRKQSLHVKYMNNQRAFKVEAGECTNGGRPEKKDIVQRWRLEHPDGRKVDCILETGLSKPTVLKWW